jgi:gliding motility-associated lipoprotein GldH
MKYAAFLLLFTGWAFWGCGDDLLFEKKSEIPGQSWAYEDTVHFGFTITDTSSAYALLLDVEHTTEYGFQNLYTQIHTRLPDGEIKKQALSLELAASSGKWNGECSSRTCKVEIPIQPKARFKTPGHYRVSFEQYMRQSPLPGIKSIRLKIKAL